MSKSQAIRLVRQGAVKIWIDDKWVKITDPDFILKSGMVLRIGKHRFYKIK